MRKFLLALTIAAAALVSSCTGPDLDVPNVEEDLYFGLTMNDAEILHRGNYYNNESSNFIVYLYMLDNSGAATRVVAAEINTPDVNDGIIPEGKYSIADASMVEGELNPVIKGSHFLRMVGENQVIMFVTEGSIEVKHKGEGEYDFNVSFTDGYDPSGEACTAVECRYTGKPKNIGMKDNNFEVFVPVYCEAIYEPLDETMAAWTITLYSEGALTGKYPIQLAQTIILTPATGAAALPLGEFEVDTYGLMVSNSQYVSAVVTLPSANDKPIENYAITGKMKIQALGEGKYAITNEAYAENAAYKQTFSGDVAIFDETPQVHEIDQAVGVYQIYEGAPYYALLLADFESESIFQFLVNVDLDTTFEEGIPSGTYVAGTDYSPGTWDQGYSSGGGAGGSMILNLEQNQAKALLVGGNLMIQNNGDGTYEVAFECVDQANESWMGEFSGTIEMQDGSNGQQPGGGGEGGGEGGGNDSGLPVISLNFDTAQMGFMGLGEWVVYIGDSTSNDGTGVLYMLDCYNAEDATFAEGLASGTYTFAESYEPLTIWPGYTGSDGYLYGSLMLTFAQDGAYDIVNNGTVEVTNNGGDNYTFVVDVWGERYNGQGTYSGPVVVQDATQQGAAVAKAPAKKNYVEWSNYGIGSNVKGLNNSLEFKPAFKLSKAL